jgi:pilus assembly protein CpaB
MAAGKNRGGRIVLYLLLILIAGAVLAYLLITKKNGGPSPAAPAATPTPSYELIDIVVASQFIPRGALITNEVLTTIRYPKNELAAGTFFTSIDEAVGTKAKYNIDPAVPLTSSMVLHENGGSLASFDIPSGQTAYALAVSPETAVAYAPQSGDHVMVIGCLLLTDLDSGFQTRLPNNTMVAITAGSLTKDPVEGSSISIALSGDAATMANPYGRFELDPASNQAVYVVPSETQRPRLICQTVIQDAMVLKVGMFPLVEEKAGIVSTPTPVVATEQATTTTGPSYPGSVTIVVSPQDNLILNYLALAGAKLSLALRSAGDNSTITTDPVTLQYIMDQKNIPSPLKLPYGIEPRVDTLLFPNFNEYILVQP